MSVPSKVYAATATKGVYYTANFNEAEPTWGDGQPTWAAVNTGLAHTQVKQFALDPFAPELRQTVLLIDGSLNIRESGGDWVEVYAGVGVANIGPNAISQGHDYEFVKSFCFDTLNPGVMWILLTDGRLDHDPTARKSTDYGATWGGAVTTYEAGIGKTNQAGNIRAHGDYIWHSWNGNNGSSTYWIYSIYGGAIDTWDSEIVISGGAQACGHMHQNPLEPSKIYGAPLGAGATVDLSRGLPEENLVLDIAHMFRTQQFRFHKTDINRQWHVGREADNKLRETRNRWATVYSTSDALSIRVMAIAPQHDAETDFIFGLALNLVSDPKQYHHVGLMTGEGSSTVYGRSGTNHHTSPYTDAIPEDAGGIVWDGVQAIIITPSEGPTPPPGSTITPPGGSPITLGGDAYVQGVTFPDYLGYEIGEPMPGDRGAFPVDTKARAQLHASDIRRERSRYHLPLWDAEVGDAPVWGGADWVPTNIATQAELDALTLNDLFDVDADAPDDGNALVFNSTDGEWEPLDVLTPTEHTAIGDGAPHHAVATLGVGNDPALAMVGQEFTLDLSGVAATTYHEPVISGDTPDDPQLTFDEGGDIVMAEVAI